MRSFSRSLNLTLLEPQSRFRDKPFKIQVVYPQNGAAVLNGCKMFHNKRPV